MIWTKEKVNGKVLNLWKNHIETWFLAHLEINGYFYVVNYFKMMLQFLCNTMNQNLELGLILIFKQPKLQEKISKFVMNKDA